MSDSDSDSSSNQQQSLPQTSSSSKKRPSALKYVSSSKSNQNSKAKELNILIIGETGVGKSTWINGTANYMAYETLNDAQESDQICLIPSKFTITDENIQERVIKVGSDDNEVTETGQSATQAATSYIMHWRDSNDQEYRVRLIDTPGIGDVRGPDQDKMNMSNILMYLATVGDLNGICILLPPNKARLSLLFQYCLNELLTHLHKDAARNIVFVFTNARSTLYRPGDTMPTLREFLKKIEEKQKVNMRTEPDTVYCLDNEAFRYLCACHDGVTFDDDDQENFEKSWNKSKKENDRLFEYISQLKPHSIKDTVTLNEARRLILTLAKPLADITSNIQTNIKIINDKKQLLQNNDSKEVDLSKKLNVTTVSIEAVPLGFPRTVCTAAKCIETRNIENAGSAQQTIYKTHCHDHCYLNGIVPERVPDPGLRGCAAMGGKETCQKCGCRWEQHMHITYDQTQKSSQTKDPEIERLIKQNADDKTITDTAIKNCNTLIKEYEHEQKTITRISIKFGIFLKKNAILPYNDVFEAYVNHAIEEEERCVVASKDDAKLKKFKRMLAEYIEERRIIEAAMNAKGEAVTPAEVKIMHNELISLKHKGKEIAQMLGVAKDAQAKMVKDQEKHSKGKSSPSTPSATNRLLNSLIGHLTSSNSSGVSAAQLEELKKVLGSMTVSGNGSP